TRQLRPRRREFFRELGQGASSYRLTLLTGFVIQSATMELAKKECILVEAARAFARWGFKKTSVDEIAKAAGVAKGTIYLAAESREDRFYQAVDRAVRRGVGAGR